MTGTASVILTGHASADAMNHLVSSLIYTPERAFSWGPIWVLTCACGQKFEALDAIECNQNHENHLMERFLEDAGK